MRNHISYEVTRGDTSVYSIQDVEDQEDSFTDNNRKSFLPIPTETSDLNFFVNARKRHSGVEPIHRSSWKCNL